VGIRICELPELLLLFKALFLVRGLVFLEKLIGVSDSVKDVLLVKVKLYRS
jgi:hypothetical protein